MPTDLKAHEMLALARAVAHSDYTQAIAILRRQSPQTAADLAFIAHCHWLLREEPQAIAAAHEAITLSPDCFDAHQVLASLYAQRRDHALALLHTKRALSAYRPLAMPVAMKWAIALINILFRRRNNKATHTQPHSTPSDDDRWLRWARDYVHWNDQQGTLVAANQPYPPAPVPSPRRR